MRVPKYTPIRALGVWVVILGFLSLWLDHRIDGLEKPLHQEGVVIELPDHTRSVCDITWGTPIEFADCKAKP